MTHEVTHGIESIPGFVQETDFKQIDWDKTVSIIGSNGNCDILRNPNTVGYVGPDLQANKIDKWLWRFWGIHKEN
jgi:hypothetical protein